MIKIKSILNSIRDKFSPRKPEDVFMLVVRDWAVQSHREVRHRYAGKPYSYHLKMVYEFGKKYSYLIPMEKRSQVLASCWTHDLIEDARKSYHDVYRVCGPIVADITYALTNEKGKTRSQRANSKYYKGIRDVEHADFVKLCDRLANVKHSALTGSKMMAVYAKEHSKFKKELYTDELKPMFDEMESIILSKIYLNINFNI